jgi:hypothetical protein
MAPRISTARWNMIHHSYFILQAHLHINFRRSDCCQINESSYLFVKMQRGLLIWLTRQHSAHSPEVFLLSTSHKSVFAFEDLHISHQIASLFISFSVVPPPKTSSANQCSASLKHTHGPTYLIDLSFSNSPL